MIARAARIGSLLLLAACGSDKANQQPDAFVPPTPDAPPDAPPIPKGTVAIKLQSIDGAAYLAPLTLGGSQMQSVIADTGSSTLAVASSTCTNCGVMPLYTPGASAVDQHKTASATYGGGTGWNGEIYKDSVQLGAAADVPVSFAAITKSNNFFMPLEVGQPAPYQGIMGLGPDGLLSAGTTSYVTTAITAGMNPIIAFQLCADSGTMWIGGVDASAQASAPVTTPMIAQLPYYAVQVSDIALGSDSLGITESGYGPTIVDTGTSLSFIPNAALTKLESEITSAPGYAQVFGTQTLSSGPGCMTTTMAASDIDAALPPLHVTFAGTTDPADLPATSSYLIANGANTWCFAFGDSSKLFGTQITASLYGDSLLHAFTTTFDIGNKQMQFAPQAGCAEPAIAKADAKPAPHYQPGIPWWQQDPRVRLPSPQLLHEVARMQAR